MTEALRKKITTYIEWLKQQTNSNGYLDSHYVSQLEAFETVLGWMDEIPPEPDQLPAWAIDAIEKEISGLWEEYANTGITRLDACARNLEWVLSLRKPEEKE